MEREPDPSAASRIDLAEDRTILANERTFAGWMRAALACIAIGLGFHALFERMQPAWLPRAIATAFLLLGAVVILLAERRAAAVLKRLDSHIIESAKVINIRLFTMVIALGAIILSVALWLADLR